MLSGLRGEDSTTALCRREGIAEGAVLQLIDRSPGSSKVWNRIPDQIRQQIVELALTRPELSSRELAVTFTDAKGYFVSMGGRAPRVSPPCRRYRPRSHLRGETGWFQSSGPSVFPCATSP